jgi:hypothetical protein
MISVNKFDNDSNIVNEGGVLDDELQRGRSVTKSNADTNIEDITNIEDEN